MNQAESFLDSIVNDPDAIIAWAKKEIKLYQELIDTVEKQKERVK